jgi:fumarate reductase subunit C
MSGPVDCRSITRADFAAPSSTYFGPARAYLSRYHAELNSIFIAWFVAHLLLFIRAVSRATAKYQRSLWSRHPVVVI